MHDTIAHERKRQPDLDSKLIKWLACSAVVFLLYLGITTTLNVKEISKLSARLDILEAKLPTPEFVATKETDIVNSHLERREDANGTSLQLIPHPIYYNVLTLPMMHPNTTSVSNGTQHEKRYLWWALGGIFKVSESGIGIYQLISSCPSWADSTETDDATKIGCVYGAISTLVTVAGALWIGANTAALVGLTFAIINAAGKRDEASLQQYSHMLIDYQTAMVNYTGLPMTPMFSIQGDLMMHNKSGMPLMFGYNPKGDGMVFTQKFYESTNTSYIAYGMVPAPLANGKRNDYFNEEDFTAGGLEAGYGYNQAQDGGYLSVQNDYAQMDHQVSCTYAGVGDNALEFQIYDNNHEGTIAAGNIRAYQSSTFDIPSLEDSIAAPLPERAGCQVA